MSMDEVIKGEFETLKYAKGTVDGVPVEVTLDYQRTGNFSYCVRIRRTDKTYGYSYKPFNTLFFAKKYFNKILRKTLR